MQATRIGLIAIGAALPWLSFIGWFSQPERNLLGPMGRLGVTITLAVQCFSVAAGFGFVAVMSTWTEDRGWRAARVWSWIAFGAGVPLAWIATTLRAAFWPGETVPEIAVFCALVALVLVPLLVTPRWTGLMAVIGTILPVGILAAIIVAATSGTGFLILLGPATAYCVSVSLSASAASFARI